MKKDSRPRSHSTRSTLNLLSTSDVAARKGCTRQAVLDAVKRGDLNASQVGRTWVVSDDDALAVWTVKETGGRMHRDKHPSST